MVKEGKKQIREGEGGKEVAKNKFVVQLSSKEEKHLKDIRKSKKRCYKDLEGGHLSIQNLQNLLEQSESENEAEAKWSELAGHIIEPEKVTVSTGKTLDFENKGIETTGKIFIIQSKNGSQGLDLITARSMCAARGARLATAEELRHAVDECSFSTCSRGWLADSSIGTIVCGMLGSGLWAVKKIDVQIEDEPSSDKRYDAFCVKDTDKPCGDPPSFPNTVLQDHRAYEMGDEMTYVCVRGYVMANGYTSFSLLCDSCGEWYGLVQACSKDGSEVQVDYEDKFTDESTISFPGSEEDAELANSNSKEQEKAEAKVDKTDTDTSETDKQSPQVRTESPLSLLLKKHLFWFPSEAFQEKDQTPDGDNHIGVKHDYSDLGTKTVDDTKDFPIEPFHFYNDTTFKKETSVSTDESWLDGYPVPQDLEENEKTDGSMETEEDASFTTDQANQVDAGRGDETSPHPSVEFTQIDAVPTRFSEYGSREIPMESTPTTAPENVSVSQAVEDIFQYLITTPLVGVIEGSTKPHHYLTETSAVPSAVPETTGTGIPVEQVPLPPKIEDDITFQTQPTLEISTELPDVFTEIEYAEHSEGENLTDGTEAKLLPTTEPCVGDGCPSSSKGTLVTIIVIVLCLLILATALIVWYYKKRQQKSSTYKMNGKGQTRHQQQIEMQKV
ncbi:sushi domain-containing protein 5 [Protopterus annectens]|uniref:sushi domain-containing protein 5 n=1 Tax=Protopterus annectens TaxID=7888 RepID=UPI001CFA8F78|nr:sushi domain-containing protein 5 [Protopterus annectens]